MESETPLKLPLERVRKQPEQNEETSRFVTAQDCYRKIVRYFGIVLPVIGIGALLLPHAFSAYCVGWLCIGMWLSYPAWDALRDLRTIRRTGKPIAVTRLKKLRFTHRSLFWGALLAAIAAGIETVFWAITVSDLLRAPDEGYRSYLLILLVTIRLLLLFCYPALALGKKAARSKELLETLASKAETVPVLATATAPVSTTAVVTPSPRHWWTSTETREEIQRTERK